MKLRIILLALIGAATTACDVEGYAPTERSNDRPVATDDPAAPADQKPTSPHAGSHDVRAFVNHDPGGTVPRSALRVGSLAQVNYALEVGQLYAD